MKMADCGASILLGAISSLIASVVFLLFLTRVRPRIIISECIAKGTSANGKAIYRIKVINRTRVPIINVKAQLHFMRPTVAPGGIIYISKEIKLQRSEIMELSEFNLKDNTAAYAYRFRSYEDLDESWNDDKQSYLRFRLYATHSISGFSRVFRKDFHTKRNSIVDGDFAFGNSVEVK
jgi:hypothetical protein